MVLRSMQKMECNRKRLTVNEKDVGLKRFEVYSFALNKYKYAIEQKCFIEAISIIESLITDRLESFLNQISEKNDYSFKTLGVLLKALNHLNLSKDFQELSNDINLWRNQRNNAIHEIAKFSSVLFSVNDRYDALLDISQLGYKLFRRLDGLINKHRNLEKKRTYVKKLTSQDVFNIFPEYLLFLKKCKLLFDDFCVLVPKRWFKNELQPTKTDLKQNIIYIKRSYFNGKDNCGWLIHELAHIIYFKSNNRGCNREYPRNSEEEFAFSLQFKYLVESGYTFDKVMSELSLAYSTTEFENYKPIFKSYWNNCLEKNYVKILMQGGNRKS